MGNLKIKKASDGVAEGGNATQIAELSGLANKIAAIPGKSLNNLLKYALRLFNRQGVRHPIFF